MLDGLVEGDGMSEAQPMALDPQRLLALFPFYALFSREMTIVQVGPSLEKLFARPLVGESFSEVFAVERPRIACEFETFSSNAKLLFILRSQEHEMLSLRGQVVLFPEQEVMAFVGSPWMTSPSDLKKLGLSLTDFALHDSIVDSLHLIQTQNLALQETRKLADLLRKQKLRLTETNTELTEQYTALEQAERALQQRTEALSLANAELARASRMKDEFLASMSHELRTPLNTILGMTEALTDRIYGPLTAEQEGSLKYVREGGQHLLSLINDILDLSKVSAGKLELNCEQLSVAAVCQMSLRMVREQAMRKGIKTVLILDPMADNIWADGRRLRQILVNLLGNAVKFTADGGKVGLEVEKDEESGEVRFTVSDTGIGIEKEQLDRLFEPFVQLDSSLARNYEGSGLGLSLVRHMVGLHGGHVSVESVPGEGSRFMISIPQAEESPKSDTPSVLMDAPQDRVTPDGAFQAISMSGDFGVGKRALVVEDEIVAGKQICRYFETLGFEVLHLLSGGKVIETVKEFRPDIVTLDLRVPEVSGWELLRQLKATEETAPIPIIISSIIDDLKHVKSLGASECLLKPFELHDFVQAVLRAISSSKERGVPSSPQHDIASKESTPLPRQGPPVILLAEDNESSLHLFTNYLKSANFRVVVARNGEEALDALEEITPDMILMDIQMPGMDGLEAIGLIREMPRLAKTPILALTALAMPQDEQRCLDAGANGYMTKPVSLKNLLTTIKNHLEESCD